MIDWHTNRLLTLLTGTSPFHGPPWTPSSPCPDAIFARVGYHDHSEHCSLFPRSAYCRFPNLTIVHEALVNCPAVHTLDVTLDPGGCKGRECDRSNLLLDKLPEGKVYPTLKSLRLDGFKFGGEWIEEQMDGSTQFASEYMHASHDYMDKWTKESSWEPLQIRNKTEQQSLGCEKPHMKRNPEMWLDAIDWSQLEELSINTARSEMGHLTVALPGRLSVLKKLHTNSLPFIKGLRNATLEKLVWIGPTSPGQLETILVHQRNLKRLEYRCDESTCSGWPLHVNVSSLPNLGEKLEHIAISLPRIKTWLPSGPLTWPFERLKSIASMSSLKSAGLYFRMQSLCSAFREYLLSCRDCGPAWRAFNDLSWSTEYCLFRDQYETPLLNFCRHFSKSSNLQTPLELTVQQDAVMSQLCAADPTQNSGAPADSSKHSLISFPPELCNQIYNALFEPRKPKNLAMFRDIRQPTESDTFALRLAVPDINLLRTCKQIYTEAAAYFTRVQPQC